MKSNIFGPIEWVPTRLSRGTNRLTLFIKRTGLVIFSSGVGQVVGIVVGSICGVGAIIVVLVIIFCCCVRGRGAQGTVMSPTVMTSTTVGGK